MTRRAIVETEYPSLRTAAQRYGVDVDELKQVVARLVFMTQGVRSPRPRFRKAEKVKRLARGRRVRTSLATGDTIRALAYGKAHYRRKAARRRARATRAAR